MHEIKDNPIPITKMNYYAFTVIRTKNANFNLIRSGLSADLHFQKGMMQLHRFPICSPPFLFGPNRKPTYYYACKSFLFAIDPAIANDPAKDRAGDQKGPIAFDQIVDGQV